MKRFFATKPDVGTFLLRVGAGAAMLPFGLMKLGYIAGQGSGIAATIQFMTSSGIPWIVACLIIVGESLGAVSLILGFFTRFCAAAIAVIMAGAVYFTFSMGYFTGYVSPLLFFIMMIPLAFNGGGAYALDNVITKKFK